MKLTLIRETPYDKSKEFLEKQQQIDLLIALTNHLNSTDFDDNKKISSKKIAKLLEEIK